MCTKRYTVCTKCQQNTKSCSLSSYLVLQIDYVLILYWYYYAQYRYHLGELLYKNSRHSGSVDKIKKLLQQGALVNWSDVYSDEWTALHEACYVNRTGVVKVLLEYRADVNQQTEFGYTALHLACYWGSIECVKLLMETRQCNLGKYTN